MARWHVAPLVLVSILATGCVTGTAYQRAVALQEPTVGPDEIARAISDPNWKLRCLAARGCGRTTDSTCLAEVENLVLNDDDENVRSCGIEGLVARCEGGGREAIARLAWQAGAAPGRVPVSSVLEAVGSCPSADAVFSLTKIQSGETREALAQLAPGPELPTDMRDRERYLAKLSELPGPTEQVESAMAEARNGVRRVDAEEAAQREQQQQVEAERLVEVQNSIGAAHAALNRKDVESAERHVSEAQRLGGDVAALKEQLDRARKAKAQGHLARAWKLVRRDKPDQAEEARQEAAALGVEDEKLVEARCWLLRSAARG